MTSDSPHGATRMPAEDRRREIADAALRVIAAVGLRRFTAVELAREVGVTDAALFRHFASKEEIVLAAIGRVEDLLFDGFPPSAPDPIERLGAFFRMRIDVIRRHPGISRLLISEELAHAAPPEGVERIASFRQRSGDFVRACLAEAADRGALAPGVGAEEASVLVLGAILALGHSGAALPSAPRPLPERVWATLESFLRGPPGVAGPRSTRSSSRRRNRRDRKGEQS
jgi:AcrR family transcriptional regulator